VDVSSATSSVSFLSPFLRGEEPDPVCDIIVHQHRRNALAIVRRGIVSMKSLPPARQRWSVSPWSATGGARPAEPKVQQISRPFVDSTSAATTSKGRHSPAPLVRLRAQWLAYCRS